MHFLKSVRLFFFCFGLVSFTGSAFAGSTLKECSQEQNPSDDCMKSLVKKYAITPLEKAPVLSPEKVKLGQALYFDKELSGNRDIACSTCHLPTKGTGDGIPLSIGTKGVGIAEHRVRGEGRPFIPRNAPEALNRGDSHWKTMFWDMRASIGYDSDVHSPAGAQLPKGLDNVLAVQAMFPVTSRDEMRGHDGDLDSNNLPNEIAKFDDKDFKGIWKALTKRLIAIPEYKEMFQAAYPEVKIKDIGFEHAANAIAAFEINAFTLNQSPMDNYLRGDKSALNAEAKRGAFVFFVKGDCGSCHAGTLFTDQKAHNIASPQFGPGKGGFSVDYGRFLETKLEKDKFCYRTPSLRHTAATGPWFHNGAYSSLKDAVRHHLSPEASLKNYDGSNLPNDLRVGLQNDNATISNIMSSLDPKMKYPVAAFSETELDDLIAFLTGLTDQKAFDLSDVAPSRVPSGLSIDK